MYSNIYFFKFIIEELQMEMVDLQARVKLIWPVRVWLNTVSQGSDINITGQGYEYTNMRYNIFTLHIYDINYFKPGFVG